MKYDIILPSQPRIIREEGSIGVFEIDGLYPGYGVTIGNSLRRVILSSLPGAAVTSIKIEGVQHEFSTIPGVLEDAVTIVLNIKQLRFRMHTDEPQTLELHVKGPKTVTAADLKAPSTIEVLHTNAPILTLTEKTAEVRMELTVEKGLGYVPREVAHKDKVEIGAMAVDALYSPIRNVNYEVENMRVGDRTDYNRLRMEIETDGTITPQEAFQQAVDIIVKQFNVLADGFADETSDAQASNDIMEEASVSSHSTEEDSTDEETDVSKVRVEDLRLPSRTINALHEHGIKTVSGLLRRDTEALHAIPGIGEKAIQEIRHALASMGITLK